jgi:hypothetical protein
VVGEGSGGGAKAPPFQRSTSWRVPTVATTRWGFIACPALRDGPREHALPSARANSIAPLRGEEKRTRH